MDRYLTKTLNTSPRKRVSPIPLLSTGSMLSLGSPMSSANSPMNSAQLPLSFRSYTNSPEPISLPSIKKAVAEPISMRKSYRTVLNKPRFRQNFQFNTKASSTKFGKVACYSATSDQGILRNYNEDRVSIRQNIKPPKNREGENWPKCSWFGLFDGHGGTSCANFLRDNLHEYVINCSQFPTKPREALRSGFAAAESAFLAMAQNKQELDTSGSCACVALIVADQCYIANVGDSRAIMSGQQGAKIFTLSQDHKPEDEKELERILSNGGRVYKNPEAQGPLRLMPGRLSVSRAFGDIEAKLRQFGGCPDVLIATPEIKAFKLSPQYDFITIGCDGIFDKMGNREIIQAIWDQINSKSIQDLEKKVGLCSEVVVSAALRNKSLDNVTAIIIGFKPLIKNLMVSRITLSPGPVTKLVY